MRNSNSELDDKEITRAKNTAYRYLSYRPRSRAEVERRLRERSFPGPVVDAVMYDLDRFGYVNDHEFANQWARSRVRLRGFGKRRIEQELRDKGIARNVINDITSLVFEAEPEFQVALREAEKKLKQLRLFAPEVRKRRIAGLLERKGFSTEIIGTILRTVVRRSGDVI